jgi:hypothetical protein
MANRPTLNSCYIQATASFLAKVRNISFEDAKEFVTKHAKLNFKDVPVNVQVVDPITLDRTELEGSSLFQFLNTHRKDILTPSGSTYLTPHKKPSITRKFIHTKKALRKFHKKKALQAEASGDTVTAGIHEAAQSLIKIALNSLPGGMGSPYNPFYDKGGYNAITSLGRALIATSYTVAEQMLGGNFVWFHEEEVINFITVNIPYAPDYQTTVALCNKHGLDLINNDKLFTYFKNILDTYTTGTDEYPTLKQFVATLTQAECCYLYYVGNYRHLIQSSPYSKSWIQKMFDYSGISGEGITAQELFEVDGNLISMIICNFTEDMGELQVNELVDKKPELASKIVACARYTKQVYDEWQELFEAYGHQKTAISRTNLKKYAKRNTVIISDTDSVIFTLVNWVQWFTGDIDTTLGAIQMSSVGIYWLIQGCQKALHIWCTHKGCDEKDIPEINMKNEFFYPTMVLFNIKKTYAGIISVREGMLLSTPKTDIKGGTIRGSTICNETRGFITSLIVDDILTPSMRGKLSAAELVKKIIAYEQKILTRSTEEGVVDYLKIWSLDNADHYADAIRSAHYYWMAWEAIFGDKYGHIALPIKAPCVPLKDKIPASYWDWLKDNHPDTHKRWILFLQRNNNRMPGNIAIDTLYNKIPPELLPIIDWRPVITHNLNPAYLCLDQLGISCPLHKTRDVLLSDLYSPDNPLIALT